ncbi:MAG TPA: hypothetical protein VMS65_14590, partial [Polyangiaceae bacterium]|nr:hypothetical protein [Polyangiaceae bacterium]
MALAGAVPSLVACSSNEVENDGSIRGTLKVYVATMNDGTTRTEYKLLVGGNEADERALVFAKPPEISGETEIKVWGATSGREIIVNRFEAVEDETSDLGTSREAIIGGSAYPPRTFAYVLVDLGGGVITRRNNQNVAYTEELGQIDL